MTKQISQLSGDFMNINTFSPLHVKLTKFIFLIFIASCLQSACSDSKNNNVTTKKSKRKYEVTTTIKGSVIDKEGAVKFGTIKVIDDKGSIVASTELQDSKHYSVEIPAGTSLPVELTFYPSEDQTETETMFTAVIYPTMTKFDISPLTTAIAKKAKAMGGYTSTNMILAAKSSVSVPRSNQTVGGFSGDPTKQYGGWH